MIKNFITVSRTWENNIKMDLKEREFQDVYWIHDNKGRVQWRPFVYTEQKTFENFMATGCNKIF
jgi:hypothetical protein